MTHYGQSLHYFQRIKDIVDALYKCTILTYLFTYSTIKVPNMPFSYSLIIYW